MWVTKVQILSLVLALACSFGCGPPQSGNQSGSASDPSQVPEITDELLHERINGARVRGIPEENGAGEPISWSFFREEPKEITVIEKKIDGPRATIILDIKTQSGPRAREPRYLAGQIRTEWELRSGWVLRQWEVDRTENISMKYKNLPKPPSDNSNR
jgi:hypothetical protein